MFMYLLKEIQNDLNSAVSELRGVKDAVEMLTKAVGTLTEYVEQTTQVEPEIHDKMDDYFPLKSDEELSEIDEKINQGRGDRYVGFTFYNFLKCKLFCFIFR